MGRACMFWKKPLWFAVRLTGIQRPAMASTRTAPRNRTRFPRYADASIACMTLPNTGRPGSPPAIGVAGCRLSVV